MALYRRIGFLLALMLAGCGPQPAAPNHPNRFAAGIAEIIGDPAQATIFAAEAARANLTTIRAVHGQPDSGGTIHGMTTPQSNGNTASIRIHVDVSGARTPTNLAHQIAHAAAYRHGCFNHGARWLEYHMEIALRFEA